MVPFIRLAEPYFYQIIARKIKAAYHDLNCCCGLAESRHKLKMQEERMNDQTFVDRELPNILINSQDSAGGFAERQSGYSHKSSEDSDQTSSRTESL